MIPWLYGWRLGNYVFVEYELSDGHTLSPEAMGKIKALWDECNPKGYEAVSTPTYGRIAVRIKDALWLWEGLKEIIRNNGQGEAGLDN